MARRKIPPEIVTKAKTLMAEGKNAVEVAAATGISVSTIQKWQSKGKEPLPVSGAPMSSGPGAPTAATSAPSAAGSSGPQKSPMGPSLSEMLGSPPGSASNPAVPPGLLNSTPVPDVPKPMTAEELLAVVAGLKAMVVQTASAAWKIPLNEKEAKALIEFSDGEKMSLKALAPFAARYTGAADKYAGPVMGILFAGTVGLSTMNSLNYLRQRRKAADAAKRDRRKVPQAAKPKEAPK